MKDISQVHSARLQLELRINRQLSGALKDLLQEFTDASNLGFEAVLASGLFRQVRNGLNAVRSLAREGLIDDGYSLVRTMAERAINGAYIVHSGFRTAEGFMDYGVLRRWRDYKQLKDYDSRLAQGSSEWEQTAETDHDEVLAKTGHSFGRGNDWTDVPLKRRAEFVDEAMRKYDLSSITSARTLY